MSRISGGRQARRSRTPKRISAGVALALGSIAAIAQTAPATGASSSATTATNGAALPSVEVRATRDAPEYRADSVQSPKFTQPLRDTPQSITVVPSKVLTEQNAQSLQDVLKNVSGITFTSGEGNLGWGDFFTIRGFSAEQSVTIDGVRDAGMSNRSDIFNLEQAEVYKGTGSVESGVSAVGGSVNLVSKEAQRDTFYRGSLGIGTDGYRRATADLNRQLGETSALRLNLMKHQNDVAGRDTVDYDRYGIAGSLALGLGTATRTTIDVFHQKDRNTPDGGLPIQRGTRGQPMPGVPWNAWYGASNLYTQQTQTDSVTARIEHDLSPVTTLRNQFRYERSDNWGVLSPARFTLADAGGNKTCTLTRCATLGYAGLGGLTTVAGIPSYTSYANTATGLYGYLRGNDFGTSKRYAITDNQTDLKTRFQTGGVQHDLTAGLELYREFYGDLERTVMVPSGDMFFSLANPQTVFPGTPSVKGQGSQRSRVENAGLYVNDTLTFSPQWQLQTALRYDRWKATSSGASRTDGAWGGRMGVVYKPASEGAIYASYSQAAQPSAVGLTTNSTIYGTAATANYKPATSKTWEAGSKWDVLGGRLALSGAVFRTELTDSWEYNADGSSPVRALPAKRVQGFELGAQGEITGRWSVYAGLSHLKSRITKGVNAGSEARNVPDWSANLWTSYTVVPDVTLSYGAQYVGKRRYADNTYVGGLNNNSSYAAGASGVRPIYTLDTEKAPSYVVQSIAVRWRVNRNLTANLNVSNLTNKRYWSRIGASLDGFQLYGIPGAGRTVTASLDFSY